MRETCSNILKKYGIVKLQSANEKFEKAFDQITLSNEEL
jgi:hypothetical protein